MIFRMENEASVVIDNMGGTAATARFFGIASESVSEWRARGVIPRARLRHLQDVMPEVLPDNLRAPDLVEKDAA